MWAPEDLVTAKPVEGAESTAAHLVIAPESRYSDAIFEFAMSAEWFDNGSGT
jgi:hypothetical protein